MAISDETGKLPSPIINNIIPACYKKDYIENNCEKGIVKITIPFLQNRSVSPMQVVGFVLKVKPSQGTSVLFELKAEQEEINFNKDNFTYVNFNVIKSCEEENPSEQDENQLKIYNKIKIGQYYRVQIAYIDINGVVGHFSNSGIMKCTSYPEVYIEKLEVPIINQHHFTYTGVYKQIKDVGERVYSYNFKLYNANDEIIGDSGELIHNSINDISLNEANDVFTFPQDLDPSQLYYIQYTATTINGMVVSSPKYRIMQRLSIDPEIHASIIAKSNFEEGYIDVYLVPDSGYTNEELITTGDFILSRACSDTNYMNWENVSKFELYSQLPKKKLWRDFTIEQGKKYKYAIQQYNDVNLYSNRLMSNEVYADFDHAFLFDGEKQLKIKFNPKVSNLKTNIPETKIDTIGNKFPFIFRNSQVNYREFPIAGLISYFMDEDNLFLSKDEFNIDFNLLKTVNRKSSKEDKENVLQEENIAILDPTNQNIKNERIFKLKVLEWLTNGEPKVFKSPSEGNYIVRLINCSLTPEAKLGRMLHNFNCTAYEIAEFNYNNLNKYGFISMKDVKDPVLQFETVEFYNQDTDTFASGVLNKYPAYYIRIINALPGSKFIFTFEDGSKSIITIGVTGAYLLDIKHKVRKIEIPAGEKYSQGALTYGYYFTKTNTFEKIHNVMVQDITARQFIGEHDILKEIEQIELDGKWYKNPKIKLLQFYSVSARPRDVVILENGLLEKEPINKYPFYYYGNIYQEYFQSEQSSINYSKEQFEKDYAYIKFSENMKGLALPYKNNTTKQYSTLQINYQAMAEVSYQIQEIEFIIENQPSKYKQLYDAKQEYLNLKNKLDILINEQPPENQDFKIWYEGQIDKEKKLRAEMDGQYKTYIKELINALEQEELNKQ